MVEYEMFVMSPMFHLAERNLLMDLFQEGMKRYYGTTSEIPCNVKFVISKRCGTGEPKGVLRLNMLRGKVTEKYSVKAERKYVLNLHDGDLILSVKVRQEQLSRHEDEIVYPEFLTADMAEALKLFANGDCFMMCAVDELVAKVARETGVEDPTQWSKAYLVQPAYPARPVVRRYYRTYNQYLNHAQPQLLLKRKAEDLIETPLPWQEHQ